MCRVVWILAALVVSAIPAGDVHAAMVMPLSVEEMAHRAEKIFVGTCMQAEQGVNVQGIPVLTLTFAVTESLKGTVGETVTFQQLDPTPRPPTNPRIRDLWSAASLAGIPSYTPGERVLLFLAKPGKSGLTAPIGLSQGKWPVTVTSRGKTLITNQAMRPAALPNTGLPAPGKTTHYDEGMTAVRTITQQEKRETE